jgi:hypothetical protein
MEGDRRVKRKEERVRVTDPDSHYFWKLDPDPHKGEKLDPDPH